MTRGHRIIGKEPVVHPDFVEVPYESDDYDFAIRTWGGYAYAAEGVDHKLRPGRCFQKGELESNLNPKSRNEYYWTKFKSINPEAYEIMNSISFDEIAWMTTGVPNVGGYVIITAYESRKRKLYQK